MALKRTIKTREITAMLERLRNIDSEYPPDLYSKRRAAFLALLALPAFLPGQMPNAPVGEVFQAGHTVHATMSIGMKVALTVASTIVIGVSAYFGVLDHQRRTEILEWLTGVLPTPVLVTPITQSQVPISPTDFIAPSVTASAISLSSTPTPTIAVTATQTPSPTLSLTPVPTATNESPPLPKVTATLEPTNPGLHLGQTKTPRPK